MSRIIDSLSRGVIILLLIGGALLFMTAKDFIISVKPTVDFEELLEEEAKAGMHVKGNLCFVFDCFAEEETWTEYSNGSRSASEKSHYYYAVPGCEDVLFAVEVDVDDYSKMEELANETWDYLYGGDEPSAEVFVEGAMVKMDEETEELFVDYLLEFGYTEDEIEDMGDLLIVEQYSMGAVRVMFLIGVALIALAVFLFIRAYKKNAPQQQPQASQTTYQDPYNQAF